MTVKYYWQCILQSKEQIVTMLLWPHMLRSIGFFGSNYLAVFLFWLKIKKCHFQSLRIQCIPTNKCASLTFTWITQGAEMAAGTRKIKKTPAMHFTSIEPDNNSADGHHNLTLCLKGNHCDPGCQKTLKRLMRRKPQEMEMEGKRKQTERRPAKAICTKHAIWHNNPARFRAPAWSGRGARTQHTLLSVIRTWKDMIHPGALKEAATWI